ncbi:intermembrane phospholipid transport YdbH family protein [Pseudomonas sp. Marseille-QA0892]
MSQPHPSRHRAVKVVIALFVLLAVLALAAWASMWILLRKQGIELGWDGISIHRNGVALRTLDLRRTEADGSVTLAVKGLDVGWQGFGLPASVRAEQLLIEQHGPDEADTTGPSDWDIKRLPDLPRWLPAELEVTHFETRLPCRAGQCTLMGSARVHRPVDATLPLKAYIELQRESHHVGLDVIIDGALDQPNLQAALRLDDQARANLSADIDLNPPRRSTGTLKIPTLPETPWLLTWASEWVELPALPALPDDLRLDGRWALSLPAGPLDALSPAEIEGTIDARIELPKAWPVATLGRLQGRVDTELNGSAGVWLPLRLDADLRLDQPEGPWLDALPAGTRPGVITARIAPSAPSATSATSAETGTLPLDVDLRTQGATALKLSAQALANPAQRTLTLRSATLTGKLAKLALGSVSAQSVDTKLIADAAFDTSGLRLNIKPGSVIQAGRLAIGDQASPAVAMEKIVAKLNTTTVTAPFDGKSTPLTFRGGAAVRTERLLQSVLKPQGWQWDGEVAGDTRAQRLSGKLRNDSGLAGDIRLANNADELDLAVNGEDVFFRAGNSLAATFEAWPATLALGNGRLRWQGTMVLPTDRPLDGSIDLAATGLDGTYDRTDLTGVDGQAKLTIRNDAMRLDLPTVQVRELNPGMPVGPAIAAGHYKARLDTPAGGTLRWDRAELSFAKGRFALAPDAWNFATGAGRTHIHMTGMDLAELLRLYPTEGLTGTGVLDGELPVRFAGAGPIIENGRVTARVPGGVLSFRSERIRALGRSNPGMKLVADALDDFRYSVLNSGVDYRQDGTLLLALRLEGSNPSIEKGRQINFNVNLEEDIPALLTSLQLTDRVSETIQRRVQERLQRRNAPADTPRR